MIEEKIAFVSIYTESIKDKANVNSWQTWVEECTIFETFCKFKIIQK